MSDSNKAFDYTEKRNTKSGWTKAKPHVGLTNKTVKNLEKIPVSKSDK